MRLSTALQLMRTKEKKSIRVMAKEIGIPHANLFRIEANQPCEPKSVIKLVLWLISTDKAA